MVLAASAVGTMMLAARPMPSAVAVEVADVSAGAKKRRESPPPATDSGKGAEKAAASKGSSSGSDMPAAPPPDGSKAMQPPPHGSHVPADKNNCIGCHGEPDLWDANQRQFYISRDALNKDVHFQKGVNCHDCHGGNYQTDDKNQAHALEDGFRAKPAEVMKSCAVCHKQETLELVKGVHAKAGTKNERGLGTPLQCQQCHGKIAHELLSVRDTKSPVFLEHQVKTCGDCHPENLATYNASVHGQAIIKQGLVVGPVCADCHGAHGIYRAPDERSTLNALHVAQTCGKCHRFIEERLQASVHGKDRPQPSVHGGAKPEKVVKRPARAERRGNDRPAPPATKGTICPRRNRKCFAAGSPTVAAIAT